MKRLLEKRCVPCEGGVPPLSASQVKRLLREVPGWKRNGKGIERELSFKDFKDAKKFIGAVAKIAEREGHHPDIYWFYNKVKLFLWTHAVSGLTENDFILAAKISEAAKV